MQKFVFGGVFLGVPVGSDFIEWLRIGSAVLLFCEGELFFGSFFGGAFCVHVSDGVVDGP
jgi:hypothetical protein